MFGVQLYGGMHLFRRDPKAFLKALKEMGYDMIEPCLLLDGEALPFAWDIQTLPEYVAMARDLGLSFDSCHVFAPEFWKCVPQMVKAAEIAGFRRFVLGFSGPFTEDAVSEFATHCMETADALAAHGLELWLHNNAAEIAAQMDGMSAYEAVLHRCGGKLGAQVDTGWVVCGGMTLKDFFERSGQYVRAVHHKDVVAVAADARDTVNTAVGQGIVPPGPAFEFARARGLVQLVDQDNSAGDLMADLAAGVACLKKLG